MSRRSRPLRLADVAQGVCVFGLAFALTWRCAWIREREPGAVARQLDAPRAPTQALAPGDRAEGPTPRARQPERITPDLEPTAPPSAAVRKSTLPEWMRFRLEHPRVAGIAENLVRIELEKDEFVHKLARLCVPRERPPTVELSAQIKIDGRAVSVQSWGCDIAGDEASAKRICDCLVEHLPADLQLTISSAIADDELVPFDGMLSLGM